MKLLIGSIKYLRQSYETLYIFFRISGSADCTVRVWRRTSYLCCNVIRGHKMAVNSIAFDGTHVVSASKDR
jgi:WD40 repeat protein